MFWAPPDPEAVSLPEDPQFDPSEDAEEVEVHFGTVFGREGKPGKSATVFFGGTPFDNDDDDDDDAET